MTYWSWVYHHFCWTYHLHTKTLGLRKDSSLKLVVISLGIILVRTFDRRHDAKIGQIILSKQNICDTFHMKLVYLVFFPICIFVFCRCIWDPIKHLRWSFSCQDWQKSLIAKNLHRIWVRNTPQRCKSVSLRQNIFDKSYVKKPSMCAIL